jgi:hypothetical protein
MKLRIVPALVAALLVPIESSWSAALAQESATAPAATADVVKLKDGSMYRGTIIELVPDDHVRITLPSGETRNFLMIDVAYAGSAESAPKPKPQTPRRPARSSDDTHEDDEPTVHLTGSEKDVQFLAPTSQSETTGVGYAWGGTLVYGASSRHYSILCTAPCDTTLSAGSHRLALAVRGGKAVEADDPIEIHGPTTLLGTYESRLGVRIAGVVVVAAGAIVGTVLMLESLHKSTCDGSGVCTTSGVDTNMLWGGVAVFGLGSLVGLIMVLMKDTATIEVVPSSNAQSIRMPGLAREGGAVPATPLDGTGLAVRYRF